MPRNNAYAVLYESKSKGTSVAINDQEQFNDFHLCAAVTKIKKQLVEGGAMSEKEFDVLEALLRECGYRDLNPAYKGGKDPQDPRVPVRPGGDDEPTPSAPWGDE